VRGVELGMSGFSKWRAVIMERYQTHSRIGGKQGFSEKDVEIKGTGQQK